MLKENEKQRRKGTVTEYLSRKLTRLLCRKVRIEKDEVALYELGIEVIVSTSITSAVIILIGAALNQVIEALIFLACFITVRNYSGGYHAKTRPGCFATSVTCYLSAAGIAFLESRFSGHAFVIMIGIGLLVILATFYRLAPAENPNKRLTPGWRKHNRNMTFIILFFWVGAGLLGSLFGAGDAARQIWATLLVTAILLWMVRRELCNQ